MPPFLASGLKRGLYGSSIRFGPVQTTTDRHPRRSSVNPLGLVEKTIVRARARELSAVTWPAYSGATATVA